MTKTEMINTLETSGRYINFSRSYFNHMTKAAVEKHYKDTLKWLAEKR